MKHKKEKLSTHAQGMNEEHSETHITYVANITNYQKVCDMFSQFSSLSFFFSLVDDPTVKPDNRGCKDLGSSTLSFSSVFCWPSSSSSISATSGSSASFSGNPAWQLRPSAMALAAPFLYILRHCKPFTSWP